MNTRPPVDPGSAERQARLRAKRKAEGFKRVSVWLSPEQVANLEKHGGEPWLGRTVKAFLQRAVSEPGRPGKQAALFGSPEPIPDNAAAESPVSHNAATVPVGEMRRLLWDCAEDLINDANPDVVADRLHTLIRRLDAAHGAAEPLRDNGLWAEADSLHSAGLSWGAIARRWNDEGRRTPSGAIFRAFNLRRGVDRWKQNIPD